MGQKHATINGQGLVTGFYDEDRAPPIPPSAFPISDDVWRAWKANTQTQRWNGTALEARARPVVPPKTNAQRYDEMLARNDFFRALLKAKVAGTFDSATDGATMKAAIVAQM